jgi:hypothetical protein
LKKYKNQLEQYPVLYTEIKKENSIVLEVRKNIAIHKESLETWKEKLNN